MAYIPSECTLQEYEEQIYSGSNNHRLYIKYGDTIIGDEANEYASPFASSLKWTRRLLDNGSKTFNLDCFVSQEIELVLNDYVIQDITQEIDIKIGTYIEKLNKWVYIPLGKYLIQDNPTTNENRTTYKLKDKSKLFDFKYNAEPLITSKGGKATLLEILDDICSQANVNYVGSRTFSGYNEQIGIYDNTINARIYVSYIAEQSGSIATIDRNGNLTFIKIKQSELTTREVSEDIVEGFTDGDNFIISKVVYESGIIKYEKGNDNNDTLYINSANPYVSNQTQVDNIYNIVNGLNINSFAISKIYGNPTFDPWDLIVLNYEGKTYKTFAQYIFTFNGVFTSKYETTIEHSAKKQNVSINSEATFRKYAKTTIDNIDAKVNIATGKVEQLEKEVTTIKETSGNNSLYVEDALESRVLEYGIDGKSKQETRSGKNLFNYVDNVVSTNYGLTNTLNDDGSITTTGMPTTNYVSITKTIDITDLLEDGQKYVASQTTASIFVWLEIRAKEISSGTIKSYFGTQNGTTSFWADKSLYTYDARIVSATMANWGETSRTITNFYQIEKGSTKTDFEKYGVSPSPDFPSEIKSVDGIKNLWKLPETKTLNGVTLTNNGDGTITLNGTATANADFYIEDSSSNYINGEKYYISSNINKSDVTLLIANYNGNTYVNTLINSNGTMPFTMNTTNDKVRLIVRVLSGKPFNNTKLQIQLEKSSIAHSFVPYGSWLQIKTTGKNLLDLSRYTETTSNGVTLTPLGNNTFKLHGTSTGHSNHIIPFTIPNQWLGETLVLSVDKKFSGNIGFKNASGGDVFVLFPTNDGISTSTKKITQNNIRDIRRFDIYANSSFTGEVTFKVQLEKDIATEFEPYKENISLIDMNKPNLFINKVFKDNYLVLSTGEESYNSEGCIWEYIKVEPNTTYTLTYNSNDYTFGQRICEYTSDKTFIKRTNAFNSGYSFKTSSTTEYINLSGLKTDSNIKVYEGFDDYYELCSIGDIKDTLDIVNGQVVIDKKIGKVVLDGNEALTQNSGKTCYYYNNSMFPLYDDKNKILSNYFKGVTFGELYNATTDFGVSLNSSVNRLTIRHKDITDLTQFKTWLSENNVTVYYVLAEPYTIDLGQVDISLFENINHINLLDDIETETRVKYLINNVMNGTYATKGELELTNEQFQTTITNEFNSLERQMTSITQTGGAIDLAIQSSKDYTDSKNESLDNRITNSENNYNDLNNKYNTLNGKITDMNFSFKTDGLTIGTSGSEINSKLDNKGLKIYNASTLIAIFNQNGSGFKKLIATESIQLQNLLIQKRVINTPKANNMEVISFFFNKSLIENLTDLESD